MSRTDIRSDYGAEAADTDQSRGTYDYVMDLHYYMRSKGKCTPQALGQQCDFFAPLNNSRPTKDLTRDSLLSGRGQVLTGSPECQVYWLPESIFQQRLDSANWSGDSLEPQFNKLPRACNGLSETDTTQYSFMPGAFQRGYVGYDAIFNSNLNSRELARQEYNMLQPQPTPKNTESFGSYPRF